MFFLIVFNFQSHFPPSLLLLTSLSPHPSSYLLLREDKAFPRISTKSVPSPFSARTKASSLNV